MLEEGRWHWEPSQVLRDTNLGHAGEGDTGGCAMGSRRARHGDATGKGTSCMTLTAEPQCSGVGFGEERTPGKISGGGGRCRVRHVPGCTGSAVGRHF